jgi:CRISPR type III-A-associated protein Csm2
MATKVCANCGKAFVPAQPHHRYCSPACYREATQGGSRAPTSYRRRDEVPTTFRFDASYLKDGYFRDPEKKQLRPEVLDTTAQNAALALGQAGMTSHQFRLFFNKMRAIEGRLERGEPWEEVSAEIYAFKRDVVYQVGRGVAPDPFKEFIERNVELAVQDRASFEKGFIQHFQSVLAYFVYHFRNK